MDQRNLTGDGITGVARTGGEPSRGHMDGPQHLQTGRVPGYGHMPPEGADAGALTQAQQALIANIDKAMDKLVQVCCCCCCYSCGYPRINVLSCLSLLYSYLYFSGHIHSQLSQ